MAQTPQLPNGSNPFLLRDSIKYQEGTVVSKEILKTPSGTITLFAFGQNQGLSEHTTPFEAIVYVIDGEAQITISGQTYLVETGQMVHMPVGKPHTLKALKPFKMLLVMVKS